VEANANQKKRAIALAVDQAVVMGTPVDTGRARANWQAGLNSPVGGETAQTDKGGASTIARNAGVIGASGPGEAIHLTNNVPYIGELNRGSSKQAPAGFVETAVQQGAAAGAKVKIVG
jgi:hypothetical protein